MLLSGMGVGEADGIMYMPYSSRLEIMPIIQQSSSVFTRTGHIIHLRYVFHMPPSPHLAGSQHLCNTYLECPCFRPFFHSNQNHTTVHSHTIHGFSDVSYKQPVDDADVTFCGRVFRSREAATGKAQSPMAERRVR